MNSKLIIAILNAAVTCAVTVIKAVASKDD